jgi:hypothetical protein
MSTDSTLHASLPDSTRNNASLGLQEARPVVATLQELIAPLSESEFSEMLRTRTLVFHRGSENNGFASLLDWDTCRNFIENDYPPDKLRVTREGNPVPSYFFLENGKVNTKNLARLLDRGASLIAVPIQSYVPRVESLCEDLRKYVGEKVYAAAVATTGQGGALKLHYDWQDIIILQMAGTKRWKIYDCPVSCPVAGMPEQTPPQNEPVFDDTLRPGDFLFLPAGHWHHCENGPELSLHLLLLIEPPTGWHAFKALLPQIMADEMFRMPLTRVGTPAEKAAYEAALRRSLMQKVEQISFSQFVGEGEKIQVPD